MTAGERLFSVGVEVKEEPLDYGSVNPQSQASHYTVQAAVANCDPESPFNKVSLLVCLIR